MKTGGLIVTGLGVLGLGGVAVLLFGGKKAEAAPGQAPGLPVVPPGGAAPVPSGGGGLVFVQDALSVHLRQGQTYRGRAKIQGVSLPPFHLNASHDEIAKGLSAVGFADVQVFMNVSNLPSDWPRETAQNTEAGTRWFQGRWTGATADVPRPPAVELVWVTASPSTVAQRQQAQAQAVVSGGGMTG